MSSPRIHGDYRDNIDEHDSGYGDSVYGDSYGNGSGDYTRPGNDSDQAPFGGYRPPLVGDPPDRNQPEGSGDSRSSDSGRRREHGERRDSTDSRYATSGNVAAPSANSYGAPPDRNQPERSGDSRSSDSRRRREYRERRGSTDSRYATSGYAAAPSANSYGAPTGYAPPPASYTDPSSRTGLNWRWWIPAEGISREVIQADIQRYLGPEAVVRPGYGTGENEGDPGYYIAAYRNLTESMIQDLKADSANWRIHQSRGGVRYEDSQTHQSRQYWGPTGSTPAQTPAQPVPAQSYQQQDPEPRYGYQSTRREDTYQQAPTQSTGYAPTAADSRRPAYPPAASQSPDNPYYAITPSSSTTLYSSGSYEQYGDQRVSRTSNVQPQHTGSTTDYTGTGYQTTITYASPPTQQRQARPGYYIASDGREYPLSSMPTTGQR